MSIKKYGLHGLHGMTWCSGKEISLNLMAFAELETNNPFKQRAPELFPGCTIFMVGKAANTLCSTQDGK